MFVSPLAFDLLDPVTLGLTITAIIIIVIFLWTILLRGIFRIGPNQIGILTKKFGGRKMPPGHIIARNGEIGIQVQTLLPGLYFRNPIFWSYQRVPLTVIDEGNIGLVEAIDGDPLPPNRFLGDAVASDNFQDGEAFLANHGCRGPQVAILRPGSWRVNTRLFRITPMPITIIGDSETGIIVAQDGLPLPSDYIIAPKPLDSTEVPPNDPRSSLKFPQARPNSHFQDGQAFIDSGGYRGTQQEPINPGTYYVNTMLFTVRKVQKIEIKPGFVGVIRSNIGKELAPIATLPTPTSEGTSLASSIMSGVERVLVSDINRRGIYDKPLGPGIYNINTEAQTIYPVPTSAIMIDWADAQAPGGQRMSANFTTSQTSGQGAQNPYPYLQDSTLKGISYFNYGQLNVVSKDVFNLSCGVRMIIRVSQENAAFVIARFGSIQDLISQIVHPLIDSEFRNSAGDKDALNFFQSRTELQKDALAKATIAFDPYHVQAQNLLISYINFTDDKGQLLLATQNQKQIAVQQQAQFDAQADAQERNIELQKQQATAAKQPDLIASNIQIQINQNLANAQIEQAKGLAQARSIQGDGESAFLQKVADGNAAQVLKTGLAQAQVVEKTGLAQAAAYTAQKEAIGQEYVAKIQLVQQLINSRQAITPTTLITSGGGNGGGSIAELITLWLSQAIANPPTQQPNGSSPPPSSGSSHDGTGQPPPTTPSGYTPPPPPTMSSAITNPVLPHLDAYEQANQRDQQRAQGMDQYSRERDDYYKKRDDKQTQVNSY